MSKCLYQLIKLIPVKNDLDEEFDQEIIGTYTGNPLEPIRELWKTRDPKTMEKLAAENSIIDELWGNVQKCRVIVEGNYESH